MAEDGFEAAVRQFASFLKSRPEAFFLADQIQASLNEFVSQQEGLSSHSIRQLRRTFRGCPEAFIDGDSVYALLRPQMGRKKCVVLGETERDQSK